MTLPAASPGEPTWGEPVVQPQAAGQSSPPAAAGRSQPRGALVVTLGTLAVVGVAVAEALMEGRIATWSGVALVLVSIVAAGVTRAGDRSLPAMMPPLAFLTAVMVAGQFLLPGQPESLRAREGLMVLQALGENAIWVVAATALAIVIAGVRHVRDTR